MEIRYLQTFVRIAQLQSFSKAAKELGYSQAAVTIQIQRLEEELSTRLFERFNKTIRLTPQGTLFLHHAQDILQAVASAKTCMKEHSEPQGILQIGTIESLCTTLFPGLISAYQKAYPYVQIRIETASPQQLIEQLYQNKLDVIYLLDEPIYDPNLCTQIVAEEDVVFVCSSHHPLAHVKDLTFEELSKEKWILTEANASYRRNLTSYLAKLNQTITPAVEVGNTDLIIALLQAGDGISFLPKSVLTPYLQRNQLVVLPIHDAHFTIHRQFLYHKNKWLTSPMQALIPFLKP